MYEPVINPHSIEKHYTVLNKIGNIGDSPKEGFSRIAYSIEETAAMKYIEEAALDAGLLSRWDGAGNLIIETPGDFKLWVETGSHMDTVPFGGNYDGTAGVVAGLEALINCFNSPISLKRGLRLRVWRGEESAAFGSVSTGSRAAFGLLDSKLLLGCYQDISLEEAMASQGADSRLIRSGKAAILQEELDSIEAYIELHIEQGNLLEANGKDVGIVTGIRGPYRAWVTLQGEFDHSGATPMGSDYRKDANLALGYIMVHLDDLAKRYLKEGKDIVQTIGVINSNSDLNKEKYTVFNNAVSKVSGFAYFSFEVRSCDSAMRDKFCKEAVHIIHETAKEFGVIANIDMIGSASGIKSLDLNIQSLLKDICKKLAYTSLPMPSGAWHDAAVVARQYKSDGASIPVGMVFIPCKGGKSHNPKEYSSPEQIAKGASVLAAALLQLAQK